ncbi:Transcription initiation factor TFIID subunit 4 [Bagarius yarrelli]|uniref:Transcription initiation factor TFIID subunit 4 n=1 Tax=Bagarius yarrelli TaxID=175774 RepID=A0A556TNE3_BAGYA|nr:Transcription initiation factor TFIID subunit 4 [Bagarius yarrelli]
MHLAAKQRTRTTRSVERLPKMAGVPDPLEDMLYSEVDEKAVSDLVGSLESELGGQNKSQSEARRSGAPESGNNNLGKAQAAQAGTALEARASGLHRVEVKRENGNERTPSTNSVPGGMMATNRVPPNITLVPKPAVPGLTTSPNCLSDAAVVASSSSPSSSSSSSSATDTLTDTNHIASTIRAVSSRAVAGENGSSGCVSSPVTGLQSGVNGAVTASETSTSKGTNGPFLAPSLQPNHILSQPVSGSAAQTVPAVALHRPTITTPNPSDPKLTAAVSVASVPASSLTFSSAGLIKTNPQTQIKTIVPNQLAGSSVAVRPPLTSDAVSTSLTVASTTSVLVKPDAGLAVQAAGLLRPSTPSPAATTVSVRPGVPGATAARAMVPQLTVRPQQQTTIQFPPGFTIPPGMVLVRTEAGQLVLVPQQVLAQAKAQTQTKAALSPTPATTTTGATIRVTTPVQQSPVTSQAIRPIPPAQAKVVQAATPASPALQKAPLVTASAAPKPSGPTVITTSARVPAPNQTPLKPTAAVPAPAAPSTGIAGLSQEMQENVKKCKNFLATLIKLASHNSPSPETSKNVKALVQDLLDAKIEPEEFTNRLQTELKSSPQPYLIPFLKKSLPALRMTLLNSQQSLTQLAQTTASPLTVSAIKAPPPRSLATAVPAVRPAVSQDQASLLAVKRAGAQTSQVRMPVVITQSIRPQGAVVRGPAVQVRGPVGVTMQVLANQKQKVNDPGGGTFRDDDDINDVASMAGVNLNEENARILATGSELVGTQIRSCKDEAFLPASLLHKRILEIARGFGVNEVMADVVSLVSHATEVRLRSMLENVSAFARHRTEPSKDEEHHEQSSDVRTQLKFFEQLERLEKQRKDDEEREILLKVAKSRSRQEDPEQARLKQKAKERIRIAFCYLCVMLPHLEVTLLIRKRQTAPKGTRYTPSKRSLPALISAAHSTIPYRCRHRRRTRNSSAVMSLTLMQQQELAQMRQRDANLTALAAIGPRKKRKLDSPGASGGELGECDFSKGVSICLERCSAGRSEGASQTFHLRSYAPEALHGLEWQLACQVASCAMKARLLFYCSSLEAPSPLGVFYLIASQEQNCYLRLDEPLRLKAEPEAEPVDGLVIEQVMRAFL